MNLSSLIRELVDRFSVDLKMANCALNLSLDADAIGYWDPRRIEQVLVNLLSNIIKYAPGSPVNISVQKNANRVSLVVQDQGPGIAKEKHKCIFNRFERVSSMTSTSGLGLGLYVVKKIIEAHHGQIELKSDIGQGATFQVELPSIEAINAGVSIDA
jgi:signal transduction histidine kinase